MSRFERWSRLKRGEHPASPEAPSAPRAGETRASEEPDPAPREPVAPERDATSSRSPAPGSLDHTLPDPDTLPPGSDITAYLASGVSSGLRKRALRRLFAGKHYGIRDGLDDYDDDYRQKLQPLAGEVAERLRNWTRRQLEDDEASEEVPSEDIATGGEGTHGGTHESPPDTPEEVSHTDTDEAQEAPRSHDRPG
ncbi:uncharacterized protein DUF3306 [Halomonas ventosae]|uniref:Uncharacterized protein DUF3306 n=1 Tax=Halomonas ventosae TaxID=229007 RepID=A0A4R6ZWR1_9GAMM|nr:DUF3306 domain-containing protein [Halomonas ventosae]TDR57391.1 uncharacterized protein DUF3306 [Halomonas ventosae]